MRIAVTGGDGFIGKAVIDYAREAGHSAESFDLKSGFDVTDFSSGSFAGYDSVIHLAGILGTEELFPQAERAIDVNVKGTLNILRECTEAGAGFVGIHMPEVWANVYQATKKCAMTLAEAWRLNYGLPVSTVTAYNAFGPGQKVHGVQKIVPTFAHRAWRNQPIPIWGDGSQPVDLVYSGDLGRLLVEATAFGGGEEFDGGTGVRHTVKQVAELVLEHTESAAGIEYLPMRKGETPTDICASGLGWDLLDWQPAFNLKDFTNTVDWYKSDRP